jgi:hypothetical protein
MLPPTLRTAGSVDSFHSQLTSLSTWIRKEAIIPAVPDCGVILCPRFTTIQHKAFELLSIAYRGRLHRLRVWADEISRWPFRRFGGTVEQIFPGDSHQGSSTFAAGR